MLHTPKITSLLLPPNKSRSYTNPVFFNPILILLLHPSSPKEKISFSLSLNYFPVHQPAATNSMHLQSTYTPNLQHIQSGAHLESSRTSAIELFCGNSQSIKTVGYFRRRAPSWMFDRILNATLPSNSLHLHQKLTTFSGMFGEIPPIPCVPRISFPVPVFLILYIASVIG